LDQLDLVTGLERDDRLLPVAATALVAAHALELALEGCRADGGHLHVEDGLHRGPDLHLVGVGTDPEGHRVELFLLAHALLGHDRAEDDLTRITWVHADRASSRARRA